MKNILAISLFIFASLHAAHADQCAYIDKDEVNKALTFLKIGTEYVEFCEPCGDKSLYFQRKDLSVVDTISVAKVDDEQWEITINDDDIDLAYTYIKQSDNKFWNLSKLANCESDDVTKVFSSDKLTGDDSQKKYTPKSNEKYKEYCNERFGFCLDVPNALKMQFSPSGDGVSLSMNDIDNDGFSILSFGSPHGNIDDAPHTLDEIMESHLEYVEDVTYQKKKDNWFVISGYNDSGKSIVFKKLYVGKQNFNSLLIEYPKKDKKLYDDAVNRIVGSFSAGGLDE